MQITKKNGQHIWVDTSAVLLNKETTESLWTFIDITVRRKGEESLRIAATAFETQEGIMVTDANKKILLVNKAFTKITGYTQGEIVGESPSILSSGKHDLTFYKVMWKKIASAGSWTGEIWNRRKSGEVFPENLTITAVKDDLGLLTNYVATFTDISLNKAAENEINNLAFYDTLTNLPNRRLLSDRISQALASSIRNGRDGAILFLDLDHFKTLNDSLGHNIGDLLLIKVAERLISCVREGDTVARLGGDEFVIMIEDLSEHSFEAAAQIENIGEKILTVLNQPFQLDFNEYQTTLSIGVAMFSDNEHSQSNLLKHADIAMYQAKKAGRNTMRFFDNKMQEAINTRVDLERELRKAIEQQQFQLFYQLQVADSGKAIGAEVLIRWLNPVRGLISPYQFIPLAEETGLILPIGEWVLETACAQLALWKQNPNTQDLSLAVNVSARQFNQADFVSKVQKIILEHNIDPSKLKLELTESMLVENVEQIIVTMNNLKELRVKFSLDDFGTGYSSLQYLKKLPIDQLKIDQSFVKDITSDSQDRAIIRTIIAMGKSMELELIAEGVETEKQHQLLREKGCLLYQGYLFSKPVPIEDFELLITEQYSKNGIFLNDLSSAIGA